MLFNSAFARKQGTAVVCQSQDLKSEARSLFELFQADAELFIRLGEAFARIDGMFLRVFPASLLPVGNTEIIWLRENLPVLAEHCQILQLPVTRNLILQFYRDYEGVNPTWNDSFMRLSTITQSFKAELQTRLCLMVYAHKSAFYSSRFSPPLESDFGIAVDCMFPSVVSDIIEAGRCYAFEQNTACVFHLMRVLEKGLHTFAEETGINPKVPIILQDWHNIIEQIESQIKKAQTSPKSSEKSQLLEFYSGAAVQFRYFKDAWRNHVMHSHASYEESDAVRVYSHVKEFMRTLADHGLAEVAI